MYKYKIVIFDKLSGGWLSYTAVNCIKIGRGSGKTMSINRWITRGLEIGYINKIDGSLMFRSYAEARTFFKSIRGFHPEWTHFKIVKER